MSARQNADLPAVVTRTRRVPPHARHLAGAAAAAPPAGSPYWASDSLRAAATVRSRITDRLVETVELSPERLPPGITPDLGGRNVTVYGDGLTAAPLSLRVAFAGVAWLCVLVGTEWERNTPEPTPRLVYEIQPRA